MDYRQSLLPEMTIIGITPQQFSEDHIFRSLFMGIMSEKRINAKNTLLVALLENKIALGDYLKIPFQKFCPSCRGKGFHVLDKEYGINYETCVFCDGTAVKTVPCKKCNDGIDEFGNTCITCKGRNKFRYYKNKHRDHSIPCPKCSGGFIEKTFLTGRILNWRNCGKCSGTSIDPAFLNRIENLAILNQENRTMYMDLAREEMESVLRKYHNI